MRFSIRELLLLTLVVALALGWWIDRTRLIDVAEDQLVTNVTAIAQSWAYEKGETVKHQTRDIRVEARPDGTGHFSGNNIRWRLGEERTAEDRR